MGQGRTGKAKATTQDAHEAIRPTDVALTPQIVKAHLTADQFKLYNLIWRRFVASFMTPAVFDTVRVDIVAKQYVFRATGSNLKFPGFYAVWPREEDEKLLPKMQVGEVLDLHALKPEQHFTQPPPRFTEASLIKELEEQGIGRPSTYVPIISTIQDRGYVEQDQRRFVPTWLGETVNEVMNKHFPDIVDTGFTAEMERELDDVEEGRHSWTEFLHNFYGDFKETMEKAEAEMNRVQKPVGGDGGDLPRMWAQSCYSYRSFWALYLVLRISRMSLSTLRCEQNWRILSALWWRPGRAQDAGRRSVFFMGVATIRPVISRSGINQYQSHVLSVED